MHSGYWVILPRCCSEQNSPRCPRLTASTGKAHRLFAQACFTRVVPGQLPDRDVFENVITSVNPDP